MQEKRTISHNAGDDVLGEARIELHLWRIDPATQNTLRATWPKVAEKLGPLLNEFYNFLGKIPETAEMLERQGNVERLKAAQKEHWRALFSANFDESYLQRVISIGKTHHRVGLKPKYYLSGYALVLESLLPILIHGNRRDPEQAAREAVALVRAVLMEADLALSVYTGAEMLESLQQEMHDLSELFETELDDAVEFVHHRVEAMENGAAEVLTAARTVSNDIGHASGATNECTDNARSIANGAEQLSSSITSISDEIERSNAAARDATERSEVAQELAARLATVSSRIGSIVQLIERISKETRMLALNATIESARAGEAGRGFAVVANEVKNLADQTNHATSEIRGEIVAMQQAIQDAVTAIGDVHHRIETVTENIAHIANAVEQQEEVTRSIAGSALQTANGIGDVHERISNIAMEADNSTREATRLTEHSHGLVTQILGLKRRVIATLRSTRFANRRSEERLAVDLGADFEVGGQRYKGRAENLSLGGVQFRLPGATIKDKQPIRLTIETIGAARGEVVGIEPDILHVRFDHFEPGTEKKLLESLERWRREDAEMMALAKDTAKQVGRLFEEALNRRDISWQELFDTDYVPVPNTDPPKFLTKSTRLCDRLLPPVQEPVLGRNERITFCAAVDRNGYLPTHNKKYSEEPRPGDPAWNQAHSRNRRIFDDRTGLAAARNRAPVLEQTYHRDMGQGKVVVMKDISAPVMVNGQHWGAVRIGCRL